MRTYLILRAGARAFRADPEVQGALEELDEVYAGRRSLVGCGRPRIAATAPSERCRPDGVVEQVGERELGRPMMTESPPGQGSTVWVRSAGD